jgi:excisionase family DNA binding protein
MTDKLLTLAEVMAVLSVSRPTVYRLIERGELKAVKIGTALRFRDSDVQAFIAALG